MLPHDLLLTENGDITLVLECPRELGPIVFNAVFGVAVGELVEKADGEIVDECIQIRFILFEVAVVLVVRHAVHSDRIDAHVGDQRHITVVENDAARGLDVRLHHAIFPHFRREGVKLFT